MLAEPHGVQRTARPGVQARGEPEPPHEDVARYALIGDCGTAALVSDSGSIDWLCLPRFDSTPVFARLLDPRGGHWSIRPTTPWTVQRCYVDDTGILATTFTTASGRATVYDFFAAATRHTKRDAKWPFRYLIRRIAGESGVVTFETDVAPSDAFGGRAYRLTAQGQRVSAGRDGSALLITAPVPVSTVNGHVRATFDVHGGEVIHFASTYTGRDVGVWPPVGAFAEQAFERTIAFWHSWMQRAAATSRMAAAVRRSVLTLKLLTFAPSGAVVAAPTTSLPEAPGGVRNWDYRYSWVRDASWTVAALNELGYQQEARAYLFWALNAAHLTTPSVHTMYTVHGTAVPAEREITSLQGFADARPVRVGNAASDQLQLDNWGHLVDGAYTYARLGGSIDDSTWASLRSFIQFVAENWRRPDQGIWEVRDSPRHFVHSKVMCWVALHRGVQFVREHGFRGPAQAWAAERDALKEMVLRRGVDSTHGNLMRAFGDPALDASLLLLAATDFLPRDHPVLLRTVERARQELAQDDLVFRYRAADGLPGVEGAFVACSFWLARALFLTGSRDEACELFEQTCARANDCGLLPEEIDPASGAFLGNFPQGLSHIALLQAAVALEQAGD